MGRRRETGILFGDIAGSSRLYEILGDTAAMAVVRKTILLLREITHNYNGTVVQTIGDEVMACFDDVNDMFDAAISMHSQVSKKDFGRNGTKICLRIGFHFGELVQSGPQFFGEVVNTAAHLARIAKAGQILTTAEAAERLSSPRCLLVRDLDYFAVKGRSGGLHAIEVMCENPGERTTLNLGRPIVPLGVSVRVRLSYHGEILICDGSKSVTTGRDSVNDVVVFSPKASRRHAVLEPRGDKWVLIDRSANGTFVSFDPKRSLTVHCGELVLYESGLLGLGEDCSAAGRECVSFALLPT